MTFLTKRKRQSKTAPTFAQLQAMLPDAALETSCSGEVTIWTGGAVNTLNPNGPLVAWCDECESGDDVPDDGCVYCGRGQ